MDRIRVSTVLKLLFPGSLDFVQQEHLDRGAQLHLMMECWANDILYGVPPTIIPEIQPMVEWLEREGVEPEAAEERVHHAYGYCGRPDLIGTWKKTPCVFDYKFAESLNVQNAIQMEAYRQLFTPKRKAILLQCRKDGLVKAEVCKPNPAHWAIFLSGLHVIKFHRSQKPKEFLCRTK